MNNFMENIKKKNNKKNRKGLINCMRKIKVNQNMQIRIETKDSGKKNKDNKKYNILKGWRIKVKHHLKDLLRKLNGKEDTAGVVGVVEAAEDKEQELL